MIGPKSRILIVDDFEVVRVLIKNSLKEIGIEMVKEAVDGAQAIKELDLAVEVGDPFDMMFLDWVMPEVSGLDVVKYCKSKDALKDLPIVMVTAESDRNKVVEALTNGVRDYIIKPFSPDVLRQKIENINKVLASKSS